MTDSRLERWEIDWKTPSYPWAQKLGAEIRGLEKMPYDEVSNTVRLNISAVEHVIKIFISRPRAPGPSPKDKITLRFMNSFDTKDPRYGECFSYCFYMAKKCSELPNLLYDMPKDKDKSYDKNACPGSDQGIPYGDYVMRLVDQLNVLLGAKYCYLTNGFVHNKEHIARFSCTYYNKFGYYGREEYLSPYKEYDEDDQLDDIDACNKLLAHWQDVNANPTPEQVADARYDDLSVQIKLYGDNLAQFIPAHLGDRARFRVFKNPGGSSSLLTSIVDGIGSLFVSSKPESTAVHVSMHLNTPADKPHLCEVCGSEDGLGADSCEYCKWTTPAQKLPPPPPPLPMMTGVGSRRTPPPPPPRPPHI